MCEVKKNQWNLSFKFWTSLKHSRKNLKEFHSPIASHCTQLSKTLTFVIGSWYATRTSLLSFPSVVSVSNKHLFVQQSCWTVSLTHLPPQLLRTFSNSAVILLQPHCSPAPVSMTFEAQKSFVSSLAKACNGEIGRLQKNFEVNLPSRRKIGKLKALKSFSTITAF